MDSGKRLHRPGWLTVGFIFIGPALLGYMVTGWEPWAIAQLVALGAGPSAAAEVKNLPSLLMIIGAVCNIYAYRKPARPPSKDAESGNL